MLSRRPTVRFSACLFLMLAVLVAFAGVFVLYVQAEKKIDRANETRFLAIDLTQVLRRSSDDLTRLARMFVVTGDPTYKVQYQEVLDIRDGKRLRPAFPGNENLEPEIGSDYRRLGAGVAVPLLDLMRQVGFTANEMAALAAAKSDSDALALLEVASMGAVASSASPYISRHAQAIAAIAQQLDLAYVGMDCAETPDGKLLVFEADSNMVVHNMDGAEKFAYKKVWMPKLFDAFTAMLLRHAASGSAR